VSNLPFLSKLLERTAQTRLQHFLDSNGLMPRSQSTYRQFHSTETVVTRVYNDMLVAADGGQVSVLCLLELSAAFDTVDYTLLMLRQERQFGLQGAVLHYSSGSGPTSQTELTRVVRGGGASAVVSIPFSVPQGSLLGPRLFILYTADLEEHMTEHAANCHSFADDTHLYVHCRQNDTASAVRRTVLMKSATGCLPTVSNSTPTRRRCSGLGHAMVQPCLAARDRLCGSEIKSSQRLTMSVF